MLRLSLVLLALLMASALYLVQVRYESRRLFTELDRAEAQAHVLETEQERLEVEKRAAATSLRVETLAKTRLGMRSITPAVTEYVTAPAAAMPPAIAAPAGDGGGEGAGAGAHARAVGAGARP